jgi:hypothetical protein
VTDSPHDPEPTPAESLPARAADPAEGDALPPETGPRPWLERIGLAAIAVVMSALFAVVALAAGTGGEWILAAMSAVGAVVTILVGLSTLVRG